MPRIPSPVSHTPRDSTPLSRREAQMKHANLIGPREEEPGRQPKRDGGVYPKATPPHQWNIISPDRNRHVDRFFLSMDNGCADSPVTRPLNFTAIDPSLLRALRVTPRRHRGTPIPEKMIICPVSRHQWRFRRVNVLLPTKPHRWCNSSSLNSQAIERSAFVHVRQTSLAIVFCIQVQ